MQARQFLFKLQLCLHTVLKDNWPLKDFANRQADRQIDTQTKKAAFRLMSTTTVYQ